MSAMNAPQGEPSLLEAPEIMELGRRLGNCPMVMRFGDDEPETLAIALSDIEGSMRAFLKEQLPKLADPTITGEQLEDVLMDVREEFRHILYHLHYPEFFRILEPTHDWLTVIKYPATK